jgi:hypothetical protein
MQIAMFGKNYTAIFITVFFAILLCVVMWAVYSLFFSGSALVKIPLLDNTFIAKNTDSDVSEEILFGKYLSYMSERGYTYLPHERMGRILSFEKGGQRVFASYPKFIRMRQGNVK